MGIRDVALAITLRRMGEEPIAVAISHVGA
jgi:hypothetical protein